MFELYFRKINVVAVYWRGKEKGRMQELALERRGKNLRDYLVLCWRSCLPEKL